MERIAQVLHDANKDWIRAQIEVDLPLHDACRNGQHALIPVFVALYPEGVRVTNADWLPIHCLTHSEGA
jgi:hypothetical protein